MAVLIMATLTTLAGCGGGLGSVTRGDDSDHGKKTLEVQHCSATKGSIHVENDDGSNPQQSVSLRAVEAVIGKSKCFIVAASPAQQPGMPPSSSSAQPQTDYVARISFTGKTDYHTGAKMAAMAGLAVVPIVGMFTMATGAVALTNTTTEEADVTVTLYGRDGKIVATQKGTSKNFSLGVGALSMMDSMSVSPGERQFGAACLNAFNKLVPTIEKLPLPVVPTKQVARKKKHAG
ncbi:MAG: hypothetical protein A2675_02005 [Candidatus Yonathbacteria bacterium RIFCSPHIGHO2_01_FULL_51_10]|uniref:Uncharacterized protein n=1 Tax=Candidatus Yonathbacteria bacterium RIFCSPHIGHO2_01_FULL_51_10 TaxID=1802723 RepID=A0A1G2SA17_9BACT|nr:MAG: hypothetical protein A2675_02005 [Candidatus Yonathbacteria bacterium RIFCSPHIGHO2_01_FULL_51_10]